MARASRSVTLLVATLVFGALLGVYSTTDSPLPTWDAHANIFPALSLLNDGNFDIAPSEIPFLFMWKLPATGRYLQISIWDRMIIEGSPAEELYRAGKLVPERPAHYFVTLAPGGEYMGTEPPGSAVAAAPFFKWMTRPDTAASLKNVVPLVRKSKIVAAFYTAATGAILFATAARLIGPLRGLLVALIFGLGTCAWSLGSQALWAQTPMQPFLALGIDQFLRIRDRRGHAVAAGLALGCAVACRSTSAFVLVAIGVFLLVRERKALALCVAGSLPPIVLLAAYNVHYFGSPFVEAHNLMGPAVAIAKTGSPDLWSTPLWLGAAGLLFSPARGLFVFSPIMILAFWGAYRVLRDRTLPELYPIIAAAAVVMTMRFRWFDWWGGYSYGYRPLMDAIVPLAVLLIPAVGTQRHGVLWRAVVAVLLAWSIGVQWVGTAYDSQTWDARTIFQVRTADGTTRDFLEPDAAADFAKTQGQTVTRARYSVDDPKHRDRLWSIRDNPIAFYFTHRSEALERRDASLESFMRPPVEVRRP
ncbi:MAG: hypothetical protein ABIR79_19460 [Candidatus Binatia bacterium]